MNLINNTTDPIITLKTLNGDIQTKYSTIAHCTGLLELLDKNTNVITINHGHYFIDNLLNYLRGNGDEKYLLKYAYDLKNLGIEMTKENYVFINIGGKIIYISKILLTTYFEYFEIFFENYAQYDPDYSKILIDKSSVLFDEIIRSLALDLNKNIQFQKEISFYGPKQIKKFFDLENLRYYNPSRYSRQIMYFDSITNLKLKNGKYVYEIDNEVKTAIFLISDISINLDDIEIKNTTDKFKKCKIFGHYKMILSRHTNPRLIFPEHLSSVKILKLCHNNTLDLQEKISHSQKLNLDNIIENYIEFNFNNSVNGKCLINKITINTNIDKKYMTHIELYNNNKLTCCSSLKLTYTDSDNHPGYEIIGIKDMFFNEETSIRIYIIDVYDNDEMTISFDCLYK
ncbi:BTB-POZ domain-containing protein [Megavirus chiliensis]|uniref:BTB/POZ domain-containing protein n=3 Tax=Megamimivirinae TaxID=3044648 RepID=A0A2L2DP02_MIMIV|nr:hypothetical protein MegaChil _gp1046 [Megavirus chiliensis]AEQ33128.1 BTB-POZ domain-containing protein [Megavirus chiliensis]AVG47882.1 hypothetical protein [Acanthamoeba polyphaga mimivirus]